MEERKARLKELAIGIAAAADDGTLVPSDPRYVEMMALARELAHEAGIACDCEECQAAGSAVSY